MKRKIWCGQLMDTCGVGCLIVRGVYEQRKGGEFGVVDVTCSNK